MVYKDGQSEHQLPTCVAVAQLSFKKTLFTKLRLSEPEFFVFGHALTELKMNEKFFSVNFFSLHDAKQRAVALFLGSRYEQNVYNRVVQQAQPFAAMGADVVKSSAVLLSIPKAFGMLG
jgi:hypothetical protein